MVVDRPAAGCTVAFPPGAAVLTMITVHRALWLMRLGTLPSRNSLRPAMPALPTTKTSIDCSSAGLHDRHRGVVVDRPRGRGRGPRRPGGRRCPVPRPRSAARVASAAPYWVTPGFCVTSTTWTMWSSAPNASAKFAAHRTARSAVSERSVPTMTRSIGPVDPADGAASGRIVMGASWRLETPAPRARW